MSSGGGEEKVQASPQLQQFIAQEQAKAQVRWFMAHLHVSYCINYCLDAPVASTNHFTSDRRVLGQVCFFSWDLFHWKREFVSG